MDDSITVVATGAYVSTSGTSARGIIPVSSDGNKPRYVRVAATAASYFRLGIAPVAVSGVPAAAGSGYATADTITLTGGTFSTATILTLASTKLVSAAVNAAGTGYAPANVITTAGGTASAHAALTVATTKVVSATIAAAGTGGTPGAATVTGTTGTGTPFQASVTISAGGVITSVDSISVAGSYSVNPTDITQEPVTGGSLSGAKLSVVMGVLTFTISTAGSYTVEAAALTQNGATVPAGGTGATFNTALYGALTATVTTPGSYSILPANAVAQGATTGGGTGATWTMTWNRASNIVAVAGDLLIQPADAVIMHVPSGITDFAALQVSGGGVVQVSPLENM